MTAASCTLWAVLALAALAASPGRAEPGANRLTGWTVAGPEFGPLPGRLGQDYVYPTDREFDDLAVRGMNVMRLPVRWERLQPELFSELSAQELSQILGAVAAAGQRELAVILDVHNFARFRDKVVGTADVPDGALADLWRRLALVFRSDSRVLFGLMNEPHDVPARAWLSATNAAVAAIRGVGAHNLILVPGTSWSGAHNWLDGGESANGTVMAGIADPCRNFVFEMHQYFDGDFSGRTGQCGRAAEAVRALRDVMAWLRQQGATGLLGEFGAGSTSDCADALTEALSLLAANGDVWMGWSAWAAGPWWPADYPLSLQPRDGKAPPQMDVLRRFAAGRPAPNLAVCRPGP